MAKSRDNSCDFQVSQFARGCFVLPARRRHEQLAISFTPATLDLLHKLAEIKRNTYTKKKKTGRKTKTKSHTQSEVKKSGAISVCVDGDNIVAATAAATATNIAAGRKTRGRGSDMKLYLRKKVHRCF